MYVDGALLRAAAKDSEDGTGLLPPVSSAALTAFSGPSTSTLSRTEKARLLFRMPETSVISPPAYVSVVCVPPISLDTQALAAVASLTATSRTAPSSGALARPMTERSPASRDGTDAWTKAAAVTATPTSPPSQGFTSAVQLTPWPSSRRCSASSTLASSDAWSAKPGNLAMMSPTFERWSPGRSARISR